MIRGTTAQFKFKLPYPTKSLEWITIKFWQKGNMNLGEIIRTKSDCSMTDNPNEICVSLDADCTAQFSDKYKGIVQLRAQNTGHAPYGSRQQLFTVYPMSDDIINNDTTTEPDTPQLKDEWIILDGESIIG